MDEMNSSNGMVMPVSPMYGGGYGNGGFGFGGDGWWILLLVLLCGGWGNGNGFGGGVGGGSFGGAFPWLMTGQAGINANTNAGFDNAALASQLSGIQSGITSGFGDVATSLCGGFAGVTAAVTGAQNAIAQQLYSNQIADMQTNFGLQSQLAQCCCDNKAATADLKYTIATEACNDRAAVSQGIQTILDKLCALELDGYKRENDNLRSQLNMATLRESQTAQNAFISNGFANEVDALYNRLNSCPVPTTPVYGRTPIFTCGGNVAPGCGCGCAA